MPTHSLFHYSRALRGAASALLAFLALSTAQAQTWPTARPISLVVGYPAGGSVDLVARIIAEPLAKRLGTPVIIENVGGAGGTIGAQKVVSV
jgi:tripartite-type tricarboxylate transporter receptor subunit TctC